jgi:hypothetical protein
VPNDPRKIPLTPVFDGTRSTSKISLAECSTILLSFRVAKPLTSRSDDYDWRPMSVIVGRVLDGGEQEWRQIVEARGK